MLKIANELFLKMNDTVLYVHFKSNEHIEEGLNGETDLDLLVQEKSKKRLYQILDSLKCVKVNSPSEQEFDGVEHWLGCDSETGKMIHLHIYYHLITGKAYVKEKHIPWEKIAFQTFDMYSDGECEVKIVCPEFEIVLLMTRIIYKATLRKLVAYKSNFYKAISKNDLKEMEYLAGRIDDSKLKGILKEVFEHSSDDVMDQFINSIRDNNLQQLFDLHIEMVKKYLDFSEVDNALECIKSDFFKAKRYIQKQKKKNLGTWNTTQKCIQGQGLIVAVIGCDGTGKSTVSKDLYDWLNWKLETKKIYLGSGDGYFSIYKWMKNQLVKKTKNNQKNKQKLATIKQKNALIVFLENFSSLKVSKRCYKVISKANQFTKRGNFVVTDRYPQIQFEGISDGPKIKNKKTYMAKKEMLNLQKCVNISPDILVKLTGSLETIFARRGDENTREDLSRKIDIVDQIEYEGSYVICKDTSMPYDQELAEIKTEIWEIIYQRGKIDIEQFN